jgi:hypothetical protein
MKRWILVPCLVLVSTLVVLVPAGAGASSLSATMLASGKPVQVTISQVGQEPEYTFAATADRNVAFNVTNFDITATSGVEPYFFLEFYEPNGSHYVNEGFGRDGYYNFSPPVGGTWSIAVVPNLTSVGSFTLTFANDVPTVALSSGKPVNTSIKFWGQEAGYTFAVKANNNVTFNVTNFDITATSGVEPYFFLEFYEPNGSHYVNEGFGDDGYYNFSPPVGGTWSIAVIPNFDSVGSFTIKLT